MHRSGGRKDDRGEKPQFPRSKSTERLQNKDPLPVMLRSRHWFYPLGELVIDDGPTTIVYLDITAASRGFLSGRFAYKLDDKMYEISEGLAEIIRTRCAMDVGINCLIVGQDLVKDFRICYFYKWNERDCTGAYFLVPISVKFIADYLRSYEKRWGAPEVEEKRCR